MSLAVPVGGLSGSFVMHVQVSETQPVCQLRYRAEESIWVRSWMETKLPSFIPLRDALRGSSLGSIDLNAVSELTGTRSFAQVRYRTLPIG